MSTNIVPGTVNLDPDGVNAYGSLAAPSDAQCSTPTKVDDLLTRLDDIAADVSDHPSLAYEKLRSLRGAIIALQTSSSVSDPKWSPTPPTKDGWYWVAESSFLTKPVWVLSGRAQEPDFWDDSFDVVSATETLGLLWYGPVQPPTPRSDSDN